MGDEKFDGSSCLTDDSRAAGNLPPAMPALMSIGRYVRENFRPIASKFMWWAIIAAPASIAIKTRGSHFSIADRVGMVLLTWVIAAIGISAIVAICLSIAGWFKFHQHQTYRPGQHRPRHSRPWLCGGVQLLLILRRLALATHDLNFERVVASSCDRCR